MSSSMSATMVSMRLYLVPPRPRTFYTGEASDRAMRLGGCMLRRIQSINDPASADAIHSRREASISQLSSQVGQRRKTWPAKNARSHTLLQGALSHGEKPT